MKVESYPARPVCRVLLYDNNELIRTGVRTILDAEPDISVVAEAGRNTDIAGTIRRYEPHVIVCELCPSVHSVDEDTGRNTSAFGAVPMVILCGDAEGADVDHAIRAGARGVVLRSDGSLQVVAAVRAVAGGKAFLAPSVAGYVLDQLIMRLPTVGRLIGKQFERLTVREHEVLRLVASGLTTVEVAKVMQRSRATVKSHISHLLAKLGLQDRAQAIALAYQSGMITNDVAVTTVADVAEPRLARVPSY